MSLSKNVVANQSHITQFMGLILPQPTVQPGGHTRTWLQVPGFDEPVIIRGQVGWPGEILKVTVFRPDFSPAQGTLSSLEATWEVVFSLAVGLQSRFYPVTIGSHHGEVLLLSTFRVETKEWIEFVPGVGSIVRKEHQWVNDWFPKGNVVNQCVFPALEEHGDHSQTWYRCQLQALRDGKWFISDGRLCRDLLMWKASWNAPAPGLPSVRGVVHMVTDGIIPEGFIPLREKEAKELEEDVDTVESDLDSDFEIIDIDE